MPVEMFTSQEERKAYEATKRELDKWAAKENERQRKEAEAAARVKEEVEEARHKEALYPDWQLANPESTRATFERLFPMLKARLEAEQERAAFESALARKRREALYGGGI